MITSEETEMSVPSMPDIQGFQHENRVQRGFDERYSKVSEEDDEGPQWLRNSVAFIGNNIRSKTFHNV